MRSKEVDEAIKSIENFINQKYYNGVTADEMKTVLNYISKLEEICKKQEHRIIEDDIPKQMIRDKINNMFELYHERYELDFKEVRELISEIHRKVLKELLNMI